MRSTPGEIVCKDGQARAFIWEVHNIISACDDIESKTLSLMAPKPRDRGSYRTGERVLVPHTDKFYVAKVTKCEKREDGWYYLLHYQGWNKKWDEWVEAGGLTKYDVKLVTVSETNTAANEGPVSVPERADVSDSAAVGAKRKADYVVTPTVAAVSNPPVKLELPLPPELRQVLIADWERCTKGNLRPLHHRPTVADIVAGYVAAAKKPGTKKDTAHDIDEELAEGLITFFDKGLPQMLLYASERQQYDDLIAQQAQAADNPAPIVPSTLYGGEHLLRLLTKLPMLLPVTNLPAENYNTLQIRLMEFVKHLQTHKSVFMKS